MDRLHVGGFFVQISYIPPKGRTAIQSGTTVSLKSISLGIIIYLKVLGVFVYAQHILKQVGKYILDR